VLQFHSAYTRATPGLKYYFVKMSAEFNIDIDCEVLITLVEERLVLWDKTIEE
jgi:hypothetical protein